ncbi:MAG: SprT-like domain-containing protein [Acidobacteriia bacterium]|nr:SprT-like domain-containing protein [Terriglobia bacterium]
MNFFSRTIAETPRTSAFPGGDRIFQRIFTRLGCQGRPPAFHVELYPYANLAHTMRLRDDVARVRLSDILRDAPLPVIEAAAAILLAQMYRRRVPVELREVYREFALAHSTRRHIARVRRIRARRIAHSPGGASHDLGPMFEALNQEYFGGRLPLPRLGWSKRAWTSQFGCFDPSLNQIVMNRRLDSPDVPLYAVELILYHEMLHVKHPLRAAACGLQAHSPEFRAEEKRFREYARARKFLEQFR